MKPVPLILLRATDPPSALRTGRRLHLMTLPAPSCAVPSVPLPKRWSRTAREAGGRLLALPSREGETPSWEALPGRKDLRCRAAGSVCCVFIAGVDRA